MGNSLNSMIICYRLGVYGNGTQADERSSVGYMINNTTWKQRMFESIFNHIMIELFFCIARLFMTRNTRNA